MKRTTIYLDPELELLLKTEMRRRKRPMADLIREALRAYLGRGRRPLEGPPGAGAFRSGRRDTAQQAERVLARTRYGEDR
jgi:hypothetical protein